MELGKEPKPNDVKSGEVDSKSTETENTVHGKDTVDEVSRSALLTFFFGKMFGFPDIFHAKKVAFL